MDPLVGNSRELLRESPSCFVNSVINVWVTSEIIDFEWEGEGKEG